MIGVSMMLGPLAFVVGYAILMQRAGQGPDPGWFLSHGFLLLGVGLMIPASAGLRYLLGPHADRLTDMGLLLALIGALALVGQFAIDLAVGQLAADQPEMIALFQRLGDSPMIAVVFQSLGPIAFYGGLLLMAILLWKQRSVPWWAAAFIGAGAIAVGAGAMTGISLITLLGFASLCVGFLPTGWKLLAASSAPV